MRFVPRPDQLEAIESITARLVDDDRTQAIMACGTGKTFVSQKAAERITTGNPDSLILVAVPNLVLVEQMIGEWNRQASPGHEFATLAVNSRRRGKGDEDEITDVALPDVTSSPKEIAAFMLEPGRKVVFSTYQSMVHISSALGLAGEGRPGFQLDLMVLDEAHRTAGVTRTDTPTAFKLALDNEKVPAAKRLFMTATPRISKMNRSESTAASASMDNPDLFGRRAITRSLSWAVSEDLLAPYRTYVVQVDDAMLQASLEANPQLRVGGKAASAQHVAAAIALAKNARINGLGGIITYSSTIAGAQEFGRVLAEVVATLPEDQKPAGKLTVNHVNGGTPAEERARILETLDSTGRASGDWAVVTNCNCLVEGVNVPSMDAIMFVDPRKSLVSIVQAIGRPMRKDRNNPGKIATIVLPVFVGAHENVQAAIDSGAFEHVNQTITALKDVDDALSEKFVEHLVKRGTECERQTCESESGGELLEAIMAETDHPLISFSDSDGVLLPGQPEDALVRVMDPAGGFVVGPDIIREEAWTDWHRGIETALVDDMADWWELGLASLQSFVEREGHARVLRDHIEDGFNLGSWLGRRRSDYHRDALEISKIRQLESFPGMTWDVHADKFDAGLAALRKFVEREGHARAPKRHLEDGFGLGAWLVKVRGERRKGALSESRIEQLDDIQGMIWDASVAFFEEGVAALQQFMEREGHVEVPQRHSESGFKLGTWLGTCRSEYTKGSLPAYKIQRLEAIEGMEWSPLRGRYQKGLRAIEKFSAREGHLLIPAGHIEDGVNIYSWLSQRRNSYRRGTLSKTRIDQLESIKGMQWNTYDELFDKGFSAMKLFADREGHIRIPKNHVEDGVNIYSWLSERRKDYRRGTLSKTRIDQLESIKGMQWRPHSDALGEVIVAMQRFINIEGHASIPVSSMVDGYSLGKKVANRRTKLKKGTLPEAQIAALDAISPTWRNGALAPWESAPGVRKDEAEPGDAA